MQSNVLDYLEASTQKFPHKIAFEDIDRKISYLELENQAKAAGTYLIKKLGYGMKCPVVVLIDRNIDSIISFIAVVYSGNFYVPVDSQMPAKRIELILDTLKPKLIIAPDEMRKKFYDIEFKGEIISLYDMLLDRADDISLNKIRTKAIDTDPLYAIFTSGSTGVPKGVIVSHRSVIDLIDNFKDEFNFNEDCIWGNQAPFDFDVSVKDIYSTLKNSGTMQIIPKVMFSFPGKLIAYLNVKKINTIIWAVSALRIVENLKAFSKEIPEYLNYIMFSGEVMSNKVLNYWRKYLPDAHYVNLYGPTEITCNCTFYKVERLFRDNEVLPIGIPFHNTDIILLDEKNLLANEGETGEICVRGSSLALGYYNNAEKTNTAFCRNPLNPFYPELIYRTGDLGKWGADGNLYFLTRKDFQIKHMGHRIELGEIEAVANAISFIDASCCIYDELDEKIIMFYQAGVQCNKDILKELGKSLPKYMFPNKLKFYDNLPMNKNGKIDRNLLKEEYNNGRGNN